MKFLNQAFEFVLEIVTWVTYGNFGYRLLPDTAAPGLRILLAILFPGVLLTFWGIFLSPRAPKRWQLPWLALAKIILLGLSAAMLWGLGRPTLALILAAAVVIHFALSAIWKQW